MGINNKRVAFFEKLLKFINSKTIEVGKKENKLIRRFYSMWMAEKTGRGEKVCVGPTPKTFSSHTRRKVKERVINASD